MKPVCQKIVPSFVTVICLALVLIAGPAPAAQRIDLQSLMSKRVPVLLEFGRGWCKPCKYMKPILKDAARAYEGRAVVASVDMDANLDLARRLSVRLMPTQIFLWPNGKVFFRNEGVLERDHIAQIFSKMGVDPPERGR